MSLPAKARIHCATCAKTLTEASTPEGRLFADPSDPEYHLVSYYGPPMGPPNNRIARCGKDVGDYSTLVGTLGMDLTHDDLLHRYLDDKEACRKCFAHVW